MSSPPNYRGYRFPPEVISHIVWLYHRFTLSLRDIEDLLAERNVIVSYESIRQWCATFGLDDARRLRKRRGALGDRWFLDEATVSIRGKPPAIAEHRHDVHLKSRRNPPRSSQIGTLPSLSLS